MGCLIRDVQVVDISTAHPGPAELQDLRIEKGAISEIGPRLTRRPGEDVHEAGGRHAVPGLWDAHVHMGQWAANTSRVDVSDATCVDEALALLGPALNAAPAGAAVMGFGFRCATWPEQPEVAALDAVAGTHPVVVISGDCHSGWLDTRALHLLGLPYRAGLVAEQEWFDTFPRLSTLPGVSEAAVAGYRRAAERAAALGVVGYVDFEFTRGVDEWPSRVTAGGIDLQRVRIGTYVDGFDDVVEAGLRTGDPVGESGLLEMGSLKIISDGSLNTRTAFCCEPYTDGADPAHPRGVQNVHPAELRHLLARAKEAGLTVALHAIGDAAVGDALDAFEATGARGTVEHAQLMRPADIPRMGRLGIGASVQPAHLWDDRDVTHLCWADRADRCFPFADLARHGVTLTLGSDAPVSPLDPWLAMAAAVHRSDDDRAPWSQQHAVTPAQALAASTDGRRTLEVGSPGDLVLLDIDPSAVPTDSREAAAVLLTRPVAATFLAGRLTHGS